MGTHIVAELETPMRIHRFVMKIAVASIAFSLWGCGTADDKAPSVSVSGTHPAGWYVTHRQSYSSAFLLDGATQCKHSVDRGRLRRDR